VSVGSLRPAALLAAGAALVALAVVGGDAANFALRALAVVAILGLAAAALRRRRAATIAPLAVYVTERHVLGRETGVAVLAAEGRRLIVGYGSGGVALLTELGPAQEHLP